MGEGKADRQNSENILGKSVVSEASRASSVESTKTTSNNIMVTILIGNTEPRLMNDATSARFSTSLGIAISSVKDFYRKWTRHS